MIMNSTRNPFNLVDQNKYLYAKSVDPDETAHIELSQQDLHIAILFLILD